MTDDLSGFVSQLGLRSVEGIELHYHCQLQLSGANKIPFDIYLLVITDMVAREIYKVQEKPRPRGLCRNTMKIAY